MARIQNAVATRNLPLKPICQPGRNKWKVIPSGSSAQQMLQSTAIVRRVNRVRHRSQQSAPRLQQ
jgi:hypothetical protein